MSSHQTASKDQNESNVTRTRKAERNALRAIELEKAMFNWRSRHLILVLTLSYKQEYRDAITLDLLREHRDRFLNNQRCNELLQDINGYIWKIEYGQDNGGFHLHVVIFYAGDCRHDVHYAHLLGEYWANVATAGMGAYWNSNADKSRFEHKYGIGVGQIDRNDDAKRESFRKYLRGYIAKDDQCVDTSAIPRYRTFGTSQFPA